MLNKMEHIKNSKISNNRNFQSSSSEINSIRAEINRLKMELGDRQLEMEDNTMPTPYDMANIIFS